MPEMFEPINIKNTNKAFELLKHFIGSEAAIDLVH
jgi:hypothetical protein